VHTGDLSSFTALLPSSGQQEHYDEVSSSNSHLESLAPMLPPSVQMINYAQPLQQSVQLNNYTQDCSTSSGQLSHYYRMPQSCVQVTHTFLPQGQLAPKAQSFPASGQVDRSAPSSELVNNIMAADAIEQFKRSHSNISKQSQFNGSAQSLPSSTQVFNVESINRPEYLVQSSTINDQMYDQNIHTEPAPELTLADSLTDAYIDLPVNDNACPSMEDIDLW
jgi:hypothetical protein